MAKINFSFGNKLSKDNPIRIRNNECVCKPLRPGEELWPAFCDYFNLGDKAPDFCLEGVLLQNKIQVKLSDYLNKWVVMFFYGSDFTFV